MIEDVFLPQLSPEAYPYLNESALMRSDYDPAEEFGYGLGLILYGLELARIAEEVVSPAA